MDSKFKRVLTLSKVAFFSILSLASATFIGCNRLAKIRDQAVTTPTKQPHMRFRVTVGGKVGYIDKSGKLVINPQYDEANEFSDGLALVCVGHCDISPVFERSLQGQDYGTDVPGAHKYGFIDESGNMVIDPRFDSASDFSEGLAAVCIGRGCQDHRENQKDAKWGFIDKKGANVIPVQFSRVLDFNEGLAGVCLGCGAGKDGKWGFIDSSSNYVIIPRYDAVWPFLGGLAQIRLGECNIEVKSGKTCGFGFIDKTGKYVWAPSN